MSDDAAKVETTARPKGLKTVAAPSTVFELPQFEMLPEAFRELTEKGIAQAKENNAKMKSAAEEMIDVFEQTYSTATRGATDCALKVFGTARANLSATLEFTGALMTVKSPSEMVELATTHTRKQFEMVSAQNDELWQLVQKVATQTAEPIKTACEKAARI